MSLAPLERIAHDIICIVKYGSPGGSANDNDIKRVSAYLARIGKLPEPERPVPPAVRIPNIPPPPSVVQIGKLPAVRIAPPKP